MSYSVVAMFVGSLFLCLSFVADFGMFVHGHRLQVTRLLGIFELGTIAVPLLFVLACYVCFTLLLKHISSLMCYCMRFAFRVWGLRLRCLNWLSLDGAYPL